MKAARDATQEQSFPLTHAHAPRAPLYLIGTRYLYLYFCGLTEASDGE